MFLHATVLFVMARLSVATFSGGMFSAVSLVVEVIAKWDDYLMRRGPTAGRAAVLTARPADGPEQRPCLRD